MCNHNRIISISAKCSDCFNASYDDHTSCGYVSAGLGIGGGDYVEFKYCADCGQIQGKFPISEKVITKSLKEML